MLAIVLAFLSVTAARGDGEAGVVINWGDGTTSNYCVPFEGDSIGGDELLSRIGLPVNDFSGFVCSINDVGCTHSGTFNSCQCACQGGGADCTYWSFFTRPYGEAWRYSALGYRGEDARDGDLQAWQWLPGGAGSTPPPPGATFEGVCGHPPGQVAATPTATATTPPTAIPTSAPTRTPTLAETATATTAATTPSLPASTVPSSPSATATAVDTTVPAATTAVPTSTPAPPAAGADDDSSGDSRGALILFGTVAAILGAGVITAFVWRSRHAA